MSKLVKTFIFKDTEAGANAFADGYNKAHPSWKNHRAVVTPHGSWFVVWYWRQALSR